MRKVVAQHGDVIFYRADNIPEGARKVKVQKGFIIEKGEGVNAHILLDEVEVYEKDGVLYFKADAPFRVDHAEHGIIEVPVGITYKEIEREFDYEEMEARRTQD